MSARKDPRTGKFTKGNPGRPKGSKNTRTLQWEELGKELTDRHADKFNALLDRLWKSKDTNEQVKAAELFLKLVEYFKPKLQRTAMDVDPIKHRHVITFTRGGKPYNIRTGTSDP